MGALKAISKEDLFKKIKIAESIQIVNILGPDDYSRGSIKGSKKIPLEELDNRWMELDKNCEVIVYGSGDESADSYLAAEKLLNKGFKVRVYEGGIKEWKGSGIPIE